MSALANPQEWLLSSGSWTVDPVHSAIEFRVRHLVIETVKGRFRDFDGVIIGGDVPAVSGSIRVASLDTLHDQRDDHLRSADFFDVASYPEITFVSSSVQLDADDERFALPGELTIKGVTRPITLDGEFRGAGVGPDGADRIALGMRGRLNRSDYGLVWNRMLETGGVLVGNDVDLVLDVSAVRAG